MRQSLFTAAIIVALTALIGITLWANGYPPEKVGLTEAKSQIRSIVTFPLFWAGFSLLLTGLAIWIKRERLAEVSGKSASIPAMSVQFPALIGLLMQVLIPLDLYDYIGSDGSQILLHRARIRPDRQFCRNGTIWRQGRVSHRRHAFRPNRLDENASHAGTKACDNRLCYTAFAILGWWANSAVDFGRTGLRAQGSNLAASASARGPPELPPLDNKLTS